MNSIFNINPYSTTTLYNKFDIVSYSGYFRGTIPVSPSGYLYANQDGISGAFNANQWEGYALDNGDTKPYFFWNPSYQNTVNNSPRVQVLKFGDGYESRVPDGINTTLTSFNLRFENRSIDEATSILHFLTQRQGAESFVWNGRPPYSKQLRYVAREWEDVEEFEDSYSVTVKFDQVVN